ncbi:metal-dependent hydrolase [Riemerella anatipestifer]|uniref:metal-dependent hydrolase n=2 Tax=Riemerella anatipestifer TaxID=34085 RepID=UPI001C6F1233|nr:metal-dependent hydrolase [Riemerella anatipestifer]QYR02970.1 metal-dependent hydrolase [Riemerella anatipestifer]
MTAPNHIAGGILFTGIFTSLWNVNIFAEPTYLATTILISLLPDIDTPKSIIGKPFYPISKWLYRRYGHRTITHSLLATIIITLLAFIFQKLQIIPEHYALITFFAYFGHLLLDMLTTTGVPLLYPFWRNPCVIPGNPNYRFSTGNLKQEGVLFIVFLCSSALMNNLFTQGFWLTYNQQFNDITHIYREFKKSNKLYKIDYDLYHFQKPIKGTGYLVYADFQQLYIVSNDTIIRLREGQQGLKINTLKPYNTNHLLTTKRVSFSHITADSLNILVDDKFISYTKITATEKADVITLERKLHDYYFELKNEHNLYFSKSLKDTLKIETIDHSEANQRLKYEENRLKIQQQILEKQTQIAQEEANIKAINEPYYKALEEIKTAKQKLATETDSYQINELKNQIITLQKYLENNHPKDSRNLALLKVQLSGLNAQLNKPFQYISNKKNTPKSPLLFSGYFDYFVLPKQEKKEGVGGGRP